MTITGLDGQFRLSVPKDAGQLEISYVGYETVKLVLNTGKSVYNVKLKVADLALDEVVVIGYGTAKKGNVTGSIATLKGEKVADRQNENVLSSLQGQLAGVEITTNSGAPGVFLEVLPQVLLCFTLSFKLSTRPALMSAPITSCPKAESSSAST